MKNTVIKLYYELLLEVRWGERLYKLNLSISVPHAPHKFNYGLCVDSVITCWDGIVFKKSVVGLTFSL